MMDSNESHAEAPSSWLSSISQCLAPLSSCLDRKPRRCKSPSATAISWPLERTSDQDLLIRQDDEKSSITLVSDQPGFQLQHMVVRETESRRPAWRERLPSSSFGSGRTSFSVRNRLIKSDKSSRRPHISGPSDFRHVNSSSFRFPEYDDQLQYQQPQPRATRTTRRSSFRPLELSIYMPHNQLSPLLPDFDLAAIVSPPPRALVSGRSDDDRELLHKRSYSSFSFHVPRKHTARSSPIITQEDLPPKIPAKAPGRSRAYTSPDVERIKERVASAMIEMERLQMQIDRVIQRQSICVNSRPSSPRSIAHTMPELEPMPSIPALPPAAPSFAQRLNLEVERPHTAPIKSPVRIPHRYTTFDEASSKFVNASLGGQDDPAPPPPLPLVLRPPLRKKKSFSRVSTWLFPGAEHNRDMSFDSITNVPRPVKGTEGFYQCVAGENGGTQRRSFDTMDSISTWETDDEERTIPTTWSPDSTPLAKREEHPLGRTATFGRNSERPHKINVERAA